jgi:hypothetical protein
VHTGGWVVAAGLSTEAGPEQHCSKSERTDVLTCVLLITGHRPPGGCRLSRAPHSMDAE